MTNSLHDSHKTHLKHIGFLSLKIWLIATIAVITALYFFANFTSDSRASEQTIKATAYEADDEGTMNENGTSTSLPLNSKTPSWIGTETNTAKSFLDLRVEDGKIPLGVEVVSATLEVYAYENSSKPFTVSFYAENTTKPERYDNVDGEVPSTRELLPQTSSSTITEAWEKNKKYSIDVTNVVKAWATIPGRKDSARISLLAKGNDTAPAKRLIHNEKTVDNYTPRIVVTYKTIAGATVVPQPTEVKITLAPTVKPTAGAPTTGPTVAPTARQISGSPTIIVTTAPTAIPQPQTTVAPSTKQTGIFIAPSQLATLPMSGGPFTVMKQAADATWAHPDISNQDEDTNVHVYAAALMYAKTGNTAYREKVFKALVQVVGTECMSSTYLISSASEAHKPCPAGSGARSLAIGRKLAAYVIAADLIDLKSYNATFDNNTFRPWLRYVVRRTNSESRTIISCHEIRPNNWGTHCGASRAAVAVYLNDTADLTRTAQVFQGWVGDRAAYAGFEFKDLSWQSDPSKPVAINPKGAMKNGYNIDGAFPDDMRRGDVFKMPPTYTNYPWGVMESAALQAEILHRAGYPAWQWQDQAMKRSLDFLARLQNQYGGWWASGDDVWVVWLMNKTYGTNYPTEEVGDIKGAGKNMSWTDWTHAR